MNNKRDCFNNRTTRTQNSIISRADKAVSWRGSGGNNSNNYRENVVMNGRMSISGTEARWNSIPNPMRTMRQSSMLPFFDDSIDFEANYRHAHLRAARAPPPPGITPLYKIPCLPSKNNNNIWSSPIYDGENDYYSENRMQRLESPFHQRVSYFNKPMVTMDEDYKLHLPSSPQHDRVQDNMHMLLLRQEYIKKEDDDHNTVTSEQRCMPLQSIDSNRRGSNYYMKSGSNKTDCQYPSSSSSRANGERKTGASKANTVVKNENASPQCRGVIPRSWSQVVSSGDTIKKKAFGEHNTAGADYTRYTSKNIEEYTVSEEDTKGPRPACSSHMLLSPPLSDLQQQDQLNVQSRELVDHYNSLSISSTAPTVCEPSNLPTGGTRYISDSLGFAMFSSVQFTEFPEQRPYTVLKISNIPWSISSEDILRLIRDTRGVASPSRNELPQSVHIFMDPKSGKTTGEAFVEVIIMNKTNLSGLLTRLSIYPVQGRHLAFTNSNYDDLRTHLFKNWKGVFDHGLAIPLKEEDGGDDGGLGPLNNESTLFIGQKDLQGLLSVCRNYKIFYNRKCPERSFEYLMTIVLNIPWLQNRCVSTIQRDLLYECYKLVTESLRIHTSKALHAFESELMSRLIRTALTCHGFTIKQKQIILKNSQQKCPIDLMEYIQEPTIESD